MRCPSCRAKMKEGQLYCEHCGKEIQIVPEFEPEIENSIDATLSNLATEIGRTGEKNEKEASAAVPEGRTKRRWMIKGLLCCLAFAGGLWLLLWALRVTRPDYQFQRAVACMEADKYEEALRFYQRAVDLSPNHVSYLNGLAGCYYVLGDLDRARQVCLHIIELEGSSQEAYKRLVQIYERQGEYEEIDRLIQACKSQEIRNLYLDYLADAPWFDQEGGTYHEKLTVKLIANSSGTIYYTMDGSEPNENSPVYTTPFSLESGTYTIKAFFVNQYGVRSQTATQSWNVDVRVPKAPAVTPVSGEYTTPEQITLEPPAGCKVYYTTDQTEPDITSSVYTEPIPMPVGNSTFRFVVCGRNGVLGEVTERSYVLNLHATLSMEAASNLLLLTLKNAGIILNIQGELTEKSGHNLYTYKFPVAINGHYYYLYREYYEEVSGASNMTGNDYVVNYMSGECYRAVLQKDKTWKLYKIGEAEENGDAEE